MAEEQKYMDTETMEVMTREDTEGGINIVFKDGRKRGVEKWSEARFQPLATEPGVEPETPPSAPPVPSPQESDNGQV